MDQTMTAPTSDFIAVTIGGQLFGLPIERVQDVFVPEDSLLPNVEGLKGPLGCLSQARFGIAFGVVGSAMACFHSASEAASFFEVALGRTDGPLPGGLIYARLNNPNAEMFEDSLVPLEKEAAGAASFASAPLLQKNT